VATGSGKSEYLAVRPDGRGNVTDTHVVWRTVRGAPRLVSPVIADGLLYLLGEGGVMRCVESATGNEVWQERVGGEYYASPLYGDGRVYCFSTQGKTTVLKAGRAFEIITTNALDDGFMASPAVSGCALVLRTKTHLYRIQAGNATATPAK
jgi:outer membrane protein assembly factor BamB